MWGAKFRYTTEWNGIVNFFIGIPVRIAATALLWLLAYSLFPSIENGWVGILVLFICLFLGIYLLDKLGLHKWLNTLSSYIYIRRQLGTPVSWNDAVKMQRLFLPDENGNFFPLEGIKEFDRNDRRDALMQFARHVGRYDDS